MAARSRSLCATSRRPADPAMLQQEIEIVNKLGLHARAAAKFVSCANGFHCTVQLVRNNRAVNGKSIMGVMMLAASKGTLLTLVVDGSDEHTALASLTQLIAERFGEEE